MTPTRERTRVVNVPFDLARTGKSYVMGVFHPKGGTIHASKVDGATDAKFYWPFCGAVRHGSYEDWTSRDAVDDPLFCKKCRTAIEQRCQLFGEVSISDFMNILHVGLVTRLGAHVPGISLSRVKLVYDISQETFLLSCIPGEWSEYKRMNGLRQVLGNRLRVLEINGVFGVYAEPAPDRDMLVVRSVAEDLLEQTTNTVLRKLWNRECTTT